VSDLLLSRLDEYGVLIVFATVLAGQLGMPIPAIAVLMGAGALAGEDRSTAVAFALSALAVFSRWPRAARLFAIAQTFLMLLGWGLACRDYLIYPDVSLTWAMAPVPTVRFMLIAIPMGLLVLIPSLILMFRVFKRHQEQMR